LGSIYYLLGQYDNAEVAFQEAIRLEPDSSLRYGQLAGASAKLNRFKQASALIKEAQAKKLDSPDLHVSLYLLAFVENGAADMEREVGWSVGKPVVEDALLNLEAGVSPYYDEGNVVNPVLFCTAGFAGTLTSDNVMTLL
jgi:tetratricopeptide (TPR) repeat protein